MKSFTFLTSVIAMAGLGNVANADVKLIRNATILTVTRGTILNGDVLVREGKIAEIGKKLKAPQGAIVIDGTGKFVMPGIIDAHSHLALEGGINEGSEVVAAEVDTDHIVNANDNGIKWALAGGVTIINTMHGSANPIGGLVSTLKLRWGKPAEELLFKGARKHIKFALGENPKRTHANRGVTSRLGVAEVIRETFLQARDYQRDWDDYRRRKAAGETVIPPRKDLKLESMAAVLRGEIWVQCHCYRADEIEMILKLSDEFGFKIGALQHVLEGYKLAPEIAKRGVGASTFADFWGYKIEAYDGIDHNAAAMTQHGVRASVNSDSGERIRRLNTDAARAARYGGLNDDQCLALITINPAWQLGIDNRVGSLEVGKDADISIWDAHPLSVYAKCTMTLVDGEIYFERKPEGKSTFGIAAATVEPSATPSVTQNAFVPLPVPIEKQVGSSFALVGATVHPVSSAPIANATLVVRDGRIRSVGIGIPVPDGIRRIDARGQHVYPGLINAATTLGMAEIESVPESIDSGEGGPLKAHIHAADAFNLHSAWVGVARLAGVTSALISPRGTGWMGQSALMHTWGQTVTDSTISGNIFQNLGLTGSADYRVPDGAVRIRNDVKDPSADVEKAIAQALESARTYSTALTAYLRGADPSIRAPRADQNAAALTGVISGTRAALVSTASASAIESAIQFAALNKLRLVVSSSQGVVDAAPKLNSNGVPVIFTGVLAMPGASNYDESFSTPARLWKAGVKFCLATNESTNLALFAGIAAAYGLPKDEALKAVTLYPAQVLGVDGDLGSIEPGKLADLLITDGDPLEYTTKISRIFIRGIETPLTSRHQQLYEQFRRR